MGLSQSAESKFASLGQNHDRLLKRLPGKPVQVVTDGCDDWAGWVGQKKKTVDEVTAQVTARVIHDVAADALAVIEAEDRIAPKRFSEQLLQPPVTQYGRTMLIGRRRRTGLTSIC